MGQISIASLQVPDLPPFNLPSYIPNEDAQRMLETITSQFQTPEDMITMTLKPIKLPTNPLKMIKGIGTYAGWLTLVIIILAILIAVAYRYRIGGALGPTTDEKTPVGDGCIQGYSAGGTCWKEINIEKDDIYINRQLNTPFPTKDALANECKQQGYKARTGEVNTPSNKRKRAIIDRDDVRHEKIRAGALQGKTGEAVERVRRKHTAHQHGRKIVVP
jgi:hypothetical protein